MLINFDEGAMIFPEMMAEMRRPMDFPKGMICAQILISVVYLMYSVFCRDALIDTDFVSLFVWLIQTGYCFQGQYTQPNSFQGYVFVHYGVIKRQVNYSASISISPFAWRTTFDAMNMYVSFLKLVYFAAAPYRSKDYHNDSGNSICQRWNQCVHDYHCLCFANISLV
jgi:hypothetical protein